MISEFQELSDKINKLAELTQSLRRENAELRQSNEALLRGNLEYMARLAGAKLRLQTLLEQLPPEVAAAATEALDKDAAAGARPQEGDDA